MKKLIPQFKFKPLTMTVILAMVLFFGNSLRPTEAQVAAPPVPYPVAPAVGDTTAANNACAPAMADFSSKLLADFRTFLDTNFQNKASTSSLLGVAMAKYTQMRDQLYTAWGQYFPNQGVPLATSGVQPGQCLQIVNQTLSDAGKISAD